MQKTISKFLRELGIPVSTSLVENLIDSHPQFPSLLSIADSLDYLGIKFVAGRTTTDKLLTLPFPYLLHIDKGGGTMLSISNTADLEKYKGELSSWTGVVLQIDQPSTIDNDENSKAIQKEKLTNGLIAGAIISGLVLITALGVYSDWLILSLILTALLGLAAGYFVLSKELGVKYDFVESFCSSGKKHNKGCDEVLHSEGSKILGVKLSDLVVAYFLLQLATVSLSGKPGISFLLFAVAGLTVPAITYSLIYQKFVVREWCALCLSVSAILFVQLGVFAFAYSEAKIYNGASFTSFAYMASGFVAIVCVTALLRSKFADISELKTSLAKANRIKNHVETFAVHLKRQKQINDKLMDLEIYIGRKDAPVRIIMISNLYCNPCKEQHEVLDSIVQKHKDEVCIAFRFVISKDRDANVHLVRYWLTNIANRDDESAKTAKLMHEWYKHMDLAQFKRVAALPNDVNMDKAVEIVERHERWAQKLDVTKTPTFYVTGYQLPIEYYNMKSVEWFIPFLAKNAERQITSSNLEYSVTGNA